MTFAELVQSKLPTRYLGARIESVQLDTAILVGDLTGIVRVRVEGYGGMFFTKAALVEAKIDPAREKWSALRAVLGVEAVPAPGDPVPLPDPEPPAPPEPPRPTAFRDEWREPAAHRVIPAVELGIESLRAAMRRTVERGLTHAGLMMFDNGDCASEGFFVWKCPSAKIAEFTAREYQDPIRDRWLIATSYKQDGCLLVWKLTREPTVAERTLEPRNGLVAWLPVVPPPADLEETIERSYQLMLKRFYDAYLIPADMVDADGHRNVGKMARICNVDVPPLTDRARSILSGMRSFLDHLIENPEPALSPFQHATARNYRGMLDELLDAPKRATAPAENLRRADLPLLGW